MMSDSWKSVEGWLSEAEGEQLQRLAAGKRVLELGTFYGRSCIAMASVAELVVTVDTHCGEFDAGRIFSLAPFMANLRKHQVYGKVMPIVGRHEYLSLFIQPGAFDLVFIDGDHNFAGVERDTRFALDAVAVGGVIAWHDYDYPKYPAVRRAISELWLDPVRVIDTLAWRTLP
jgi:predicted O-methyltransferase YrrM